MGAIPRSGGGLPGPFTRLWRSRLALFAAVVVSFQAAAAGGVGEVALVRISDEIDANWRGAYDILVRPPDTRLDLERTHGLVEPNFLSFTGRGGITLIQLAAIRSMPEVEVAAPVAIVGLIRYVITLPTISITNLPSAPTLHRVTVTVSSSDGIEERLVHRQTGDVLMGPIQDPSSIPWATNLGDISIGQHADGRLVGEIVLRQPVPAIASWLMAVDPTAEMDLLGPSADSLQPLAVVAGGGKRSVGDFELAAIPDVFEFSRDVLRSLKKDAETNDVTRSRPIVPIVVSRRLYSPLNLTLTVEQVGRSIETYPEAETAADRLARARELAGPGAREIGRFRLDATAALRPLQPAELTMVWPGSTPEPASQVLSFFRELESRLSARPRYDSISSRDGAEALSFRIRPAGIVDPAGNAASADPPRGTFGDVVEGHEAAYRSLETVPLSIGEGFRSQSGYDYPFIFAPVGDFDLADLELPANPLNYVPLGAYDPPSTEYIAAPDGRRVTPRMMTPTLNPAGLISVPPLAITDLAGATLLRGSAPIDAIRVRVAGLASFDDEARARVEKVAAAIASLGLDVDIVAGSSPRLVEVYVPGYFVETEPPGDLGWVAQWWTTLGAAEQIESGLSGVTVALLLLGLLAATLFAAGLQVSQVSARTREAAILTTLGWSNLRICRWLLGDAMAVAVTAAALGAAGWALGGGNATALAAATGIAVSGLAAAALQSVWVLRRLTGSLTVAIRAGEISPRAMRYAVPPVSGPISFAARVVLAHPVRSLVLMGTISVAALATTVAAAVIARAAASTGPTLLAGAVLEAARPHQLALLIASGVGAGLFAVSLARLGLHERGADLLVLSALGWTKRRVRLHLAACAALVGVPAAVVAAVSAAYLAPAVAEGEAAGPAAASALLACLAAGAVWLSAGALGEPGARRR